MMDDTPGLCSMNCGRKAGSRSGLCRPCYQAEWKVNNPWHLGHYSLDAVEHMTLDRMAYEDWSGNYGRVTPNRNEGTESP